MKILVSAYACEPNQGSEPGVGWNLACALAKHHDVWVITRANNRSAIENELMRNPCPRLHFVYFDYPEWVLFFKRGGITIHLYYYLWQLGIYSVARSLNKKINFDLSQHITFVKYWSPSLMSVLPVVHVWGPVGGGESTPEGFEKNFNLRGRIAEMSRNTARNLAELDPLVRLSAKRSKIALATTRDTEARLKILGVKETTIQGESGLSQAEILKFSALKAAPEKPFRFISMGRLLHWKGFDLGVQAFAKAALQDSEYWIIGDGPEYKRLERLVEELGISNKVKLWGRLERSIALKRLSESHVLVHPSLHDSGGWVCLEAMASGRPVICLNHGGPATQVTEKTGYLISANNRQQSIIDMADAMRKLMTDRNTYKCMSRAGQERINSRFSWSKKAEWYSSLYRDLVNVRND